MPRKLQEFLQDPSSEEKELIRKLYWAITSTLPLDQAHKTQTFAWCVRIGSAIVARATTSPPPAFRSPPNAKADPRGVKVDQRRKNGYDGQAGGGVAAGFRRGSEASPKHTRSGAGLSPSLVEFTRVQAELRERAWVYVKNGDGMVEHHCGDRGVQMRWEL